MAFKGWVGLVAVTERVGLAAVIEREGVVAVITGTRVAEFGEWEALAAVRERETVAIDCEIQVGCFDRCGELSTHVGFTNLAGQP